MCNNFINLQVIKIRYKCIFNPRTSRLRNFQKSWNMRNVFILIKLCRVVIILYTYYVITLKSMSLKPLRRAISLTSIAIFCCVVPVTSIYWHSQDAKWQEIAFLVSFMQQIYLYVFILFIQCKYIFICIDIIKEILLYSLVTYLIDVRIANNNLGFFKNVIVGRYYIMVFPYYKTW